MQMQFKQIFPAFLYDIFCVFGPMPLAIHFSSLSSTVRFDNFIHRRVQFNLNMGTWKCKESCERRKKNRAMVRQTRFFRWKSSKRYIERMKVNFCCSHGFLNERKFWIEFEYAMHVNQNLNNPKWWQKNLEKNEWNTEKKTGSFRLWWSFSAIRFIYSTQRTRNFHAMFKWQKIQTKPRGNGENGNVRRQDQKRVKVGIDYITIWIQFRWTIQDSKSFNYFV